MKEEAEEELANPGAPQNGCERKPSWIPFLLLNQNNQSIRLTYTHRSVLYNMQEQLKIKRILQWSTFVAYLSAFLSFNLPLTELNGHLLQPGSQKIEQQHTSQTTTSV